MRYISLISSHVKSKRLVTRKSGFPCESSVLTIRREMLHRDPTRTRQSADTMQAHSSPHEAQCAYCSLSGSLRAVVVKYGVVDVATIKNVGYPRLMDKFLHFRAIIFPRYGNGGFLRNDLVRVQISQMHVDFDVWIRLAEICSILNFCRHSVMVVESTILIL